MGLEKETNDRDLKLQEDFWPFTSNDDKVEEKEVVETKAEDTKGSKKHADKSKSAEEKLEPKADKAKVDDKKVHEQKAEKPTEEKKTDKKAKKVALLQEEFWPFTSNDDKVEEKEVVETKAEDAKG